MNQAREDLRSHGRDGPAARPETRDRQDRRLTELVAEKSALRAEAERRRAALVDPAAARAACARLVAAIDAPGGPVSAYLAIRSEIDPAEAMATLAARGFGVCAPVVVAKGAALAFRLWRPGCALERGPFGVLVPRDAPETTPRVVVAPLLAFDRRGFRLGYGGGYYDRTLAALHAQGPIRAIGLAWSGQEIAAVPVGPTDAALDLIVTPDEVIAPPQASA